MKNLSVKGTVKKMKIEAIDLEKLFAKLTSDMTCIQNIQRTLNNKQTKNSTKNWHKIQTKTLPDKIYRQQISLRKDNFSLRNSKLKHK